MPDAANIGGSIQAVGYLGRKKKRKLKKAFDPNQLRDEDGQWTAEGGAPAIPKMHTDIVDGDPEHLKRQMSMDEEYNTKISGPQVYPALKVRQRSTGKVAGVLVGKPGEVHGDVASAHGVDSELVAGGVRHRVGDVDYERGFVQREKQTYKSGLKYYSADDVDLDTAGLAPQSKYAIHKAEPRTLYVNRPVINAEDIIAWAKANGFAKTVTPDDMHVTIAFSKAPVDWPEPQDGMIGFIPTDPTIARFGPTGDTFVLTFSNVTLEARWQALLDEGCSWDWPDYRPHITLSYDGPGLAPAIIEPYRGMILLGPEEFDEVSEGWGDDIVEKAFDESKHPRDKDGKWTTSGAAISGMPNDSVIADQSVQEAIDRGAYDLTAKEVKGDFIRPGERYAVTMSAKQAGEAVPYQQREGRPQGLYNPRLADLKTEDAGTLIERQHAVLKAGIEGELKPLADKDALYRGMSSKEWDHIQKTGNLQSRGGYNIGGEQEGATFFSPSPRTAESYADSYAPWQHKATFDEPAYVVAIKKPEGAVVTSPNDNEIGIKGPIPKSHIVAVWKGEVYDHSPGYMDLNRVGNVYREGSRSTPSNRIAWSRVDFQKMQDNGEDDMDLTDAERIQKIGARNNKSDKAMIQQMHDHACKLGAECSGMAKHVVEVDEVRLAKVDESLGLVFGYAIVCKVNGEPYYDLNIDKMDDGTFKRVPEHVPEEAMLKAAIDFMQTARVGNDMHKGPDHGSYIFAFPLTTDIAKAFGITTNKTGLMVAYKPPAEVFAKYKSGEYTGFSIEGRRVSIKEAP